MKAKVVKFKLYPEYDPDGYTVGFDITVSNGRSFYIDTIVPFEYIQNDETDSDIIDIAWDILEDNIDNKSKELESYSSILTTWVPPMLRTTETSGASGTE